jgi:NAD(P)-dependent dehydrogenase (short-subunit alcohol dehydrogenase family)
LNGGAQVTVVTGASSGIGRSLALRLARQGGAIALLARRAPLLEELAAEIEAGGGRALAVPCDVTDRDQVRTAFAAIEGQLGPVDRLVANAGGGEKSYADSFAAAQIERVIALNVGGTANCIEAVLPGMLARGRGHLVAISSLAASRGLPNAAAYSAAKAALSRMMESLRIELRPRGVDVTLIHPGFVRKPGRRRKPLQIELEAATERMCRVILERRAEDAFPLAPVLLTGLGRQLPARLYDRLMRSRVRRKDGAPGS